MGGVATLKVNPLLLGAGTHAVTAGYNTYAAGVNPNFYASTSNTVTVTVVPVNTAAVLSASASGTVSYGTPDSFTVNVTDPVTGLVPTGVVEFFDGGTVLASVRLNAQGQATLSKSLAVGPHSITVMYVGTANFGSAGSNPIALTVS
jgi:hypothetical protein